MIIALFLGLFFSQLNSECIDFDPLQKVELNNLYENYIKDVKLQKLEAIYTVIGNNIYKKVGSKNFTFLSSSKDCFKNGINEQNMSACPAVLEDMSKQFLEKLLCINENTTKISKCEITSYNKAKYSGLKSFRIKCGKDKAEYTCEYDGGISRARKDMTRVAIVLMPDETKKIKFMDINKEFNLPLQLEFVSENAKGVRGETMFSDYYNNYSWKVVEDPTVKIRQTDYSTVNNIELFSFCQTESSSGSAHSDRLTNATCKPYLDYGKCRNRKGEYEECLVIHNSYKTNAIIDGRSKEVENNKRATFLSRYEIEIVRPNKDNKEYEEVASVGKVVKATNASVNNKACEIKQDKI